MPLWLDEFGEDVKARRLIGLVVGEMSLSRNDRTAPHRTVGVFSLTESNDRSNFSPTRLVLIADGVI